LLSALQPQASAIINRRKYKLKIRSSFFVSKFVDPLKKEEMESWRSAASFFYFISNYCNNNYKLVKVNCGWME
jgi:hypothetical protein